MDDMKRFAVAAGLVLGSLLIGFAAGGAGGSGGSAGGERQQHTVTSLMEELPVERNVAVEANVSRLLEDYVADSGNVYQQFFVTDGERRVKVFCSTGGGRVNVSAGDAVKVAGTFQEYYGEYEIYTRCSSIRSSR